MAVGEIFLGGSPRSFRREYDLGSRIGRGSFGEVWQCFRRDTGEEFACKVIDKTEFETPGDAEDAEREIAILKAFSARTRRHVGIVRAHDVLENAREAHVVMELCRGGDLFELLKANGRMPERAAKVLFRQIVEAVAYAHAHGVVHRDIKPENVLLATAGKCLYDPNWCTTTATTDAKSNPNHNQKHQQQPQQHQVKEEVDSSSADVIVRLADFGLSAILEPGQTTAGLVGSRYYTAPEMVLQRPYGRRVDVWSLGVVLCAILTGRLPFAGRNKQDQEGLRRAIVRGRVDFGHPSWEGVSEEALDLVKKMLTVDPRRRPRACDVLQHPWLRAGGAATAAPKPVGQARQVAAPVLPVPAAAEGDGAAANAVKAEDASCQGGCERESRPASAPTNAGGENDDDGKENVAPPEGRRTSLPSLSAPAREAAPTLPYRSRRLTVAAGAPLPPSAAPTVAEQVKGRRTSSRGSSLTSLAIPDFFLPSMWRRGGGAKMSPKQVHPQPMGTSTGAATTAAEGARLQGEKVAAKQVVEEVCKV